MMGYEVGKRVRIVGPDVHGYRYEYIGQEATIHSKFNNGWALLPDKLLRGPGDIYADKSCGYTCNSFPESSLQLIDENVFAPSKGRIKLDMEV